MCTKLKYLGEKFQFETFCMGTFYRFMSYRTLWTKHIFLYINFEQLFFIVKNDVCSYSIIYTYINSEREEIINFQEQFIGKK